MSHKKIKTIDSEKKGFLELNTNTKVDAIKVCKKCFRFHYGNSWQDHAPAYKKEESHNKVTLLFTKCETCMLMEFKLQCPSCRALFHKEQGVNACTTYVSSKGKLFCDCELKDPYTPED